MKQLSYAIQIPVVQNRFHKQFMTDIFLFFFGDVPKQTAVVAYKLLYFRTVHNINTCDDI